MRPCMGLVYKGATLSAPLCRWCELEDGTYNLADVLRFNMAYDELLKMAKAGEAKG